MPYRLGMAWTNSNWRSQSSDTERLRVLRLYIAELEDFLTADSNSTHGGVNFANIQQRITALEEQERELAKRVDTPDTAASEGSIIRGIPR